LSIIVIALPFTAAAYAIEAVKSEPEEVKTNAIQEPRALQFTSSIEKVKDVGFSRIARPEKR